LEKHNFHWLFTNKPPRTLTDSQKWTLLHFFQKNTLLVVRGRTTAAGTDGRAANANLQFSIGCRQSIPFTGGAV
jgi:methylglyoxal synthase